MCSLNSVRLTLLPEYGDSGSWVIDAMTGDLYGVLIAGSNLLLEGYIIPAFGIFENIRQICGAIDIRLPSLEESLVQASRGGYTELVKSLSARLQSLDESLHQAASYGNREFVEVLLNLGAGVHRV